MARPLRELSYYQQQLECPVLCAGDLFHRWNSSPELINFAMEYLPEQLISIPGQHDLPSHRSDLVCKSAYWTLEWAKKIMDVSFGRVVLIPFNFAVAGLKYNEEISADNIRLLFSSFGERRKILLVHRYVWYGASKYEKAEQETHIGRIIKEIAAAGVSVVVFGDNHIPWDMIYRPKAGRESTSVYNCGSFIRRNSDEEDHRPSIGILFADGTIERVYLDISEDKLIVTDRETALLAEEDHVDVTDFLKEMRSLRLSGADFGEALNRYLSSGVPMKTRELVLEALQQ